MRAATSAQPGCGGIIEDGYCTVCGMAPAPASPPSAPSARSGARSTVACGCMSKSSDMSLTFDAHRHGAERYKALSNSDGWAVTV